jgi:hypothetical protein
MLGKYSLGAVVWQTKPDRGKADVAAAKKTRARRVGSMARQLNRGI